MPPTTGSLVLLSCGDHAGIAALQAAAAAPLAQALQLNLDGALSEATGRGPGCCRTAQQALGDLRSGGLAPLPLDPGWPLADHSHWAEQLGAARQCALLLLDAAQAGSGLPAAATALLLQWRVPLLGLAQWGGPWDGAARQRDGLPWLGWSDASAAGSEAAAALALAARLRWAVLQAELA